MTFPFENTLRQMQEQRETRAQPNVRPGKETAAHQCVTDAPLGLEQRGGKQAFESRCNGSNPCSEILEMLLLAFNFNVEVLIQCMNDSILERGF